MHSATLKFLYILWMRLLLYLFCSMPKEGLEGSFLSPCSGSKPFGGLELVFVHRVMSLYGPYELGVVATMCLFVSLFSSLDRGIAWYLTLISGSYFIVINDLWRYCYL